MDGYQFKDLNANGALDPYEDWRLTRRGARRRTCSPGWTPPEEERGADGCTSRWSRTKDELVQ